MNERKKITDNIVEDSVVLPDIDDEWENIETKKLLRRFKKGFGKPKGCKIGFNPPKKTEKIQYGGYEETIYSKYIGLETEMVGKAAGEFFRYGRWVNLRRYQAGKLNEGGVEECPAPNGWPYQITLIIKTNKNLSLTADFNTTIGWKAQAVPFL